MRRGEKGTAAGEGGKRARETRGGASPHEGEFLLVKNEVDGPKRRHGHDWGASPQLRDIIAHHKSVKVHLFGHVHQSRGYTVLDRGSDLQTEEQDDSDLNYDMTLEYPAFK